MKTSEIPEVLEKIPKIKQLNSRQAEHLEILNNTNFGPDFNLREVYYNNRKTKKLLREALVEVKSGFNDSIMRADARTSTSSGLSPSDRAFIHTWICNYISALEGFIDTIYKKDTVDDTEKEMDSLFKTPFICEETYCQLISAFAAMCGLHVERGDKGNRSVWDHLRGMEKAVISKPDLRFHCTGEDFSICNNLLTVIEVKKQRPLH